MYIRCFWSRAASATPSGGSDLIIIRLLCCRRTSFKMKQCRLSGKRRLLGLAAVCTIGMVLVTIQFLPNSRQTSAAFIQSIRIRSWFDWSPEETRNSSQQREPERTPTAVTHIGFLKVHKAASTTTQGIFLRYGWKKNLTFVLSPEFNAFGYPNIISLNESITAYNTLKPPPNRTYDILCNHVIYDAESWRTVLPGDSVYIGTVREPFRWFQSVLNYFQPRYISRIPGDNKASEFLKKPLLYEPTNVRDSWTNNLMAFEYGTSPEIIKNRDLKAFKQHLKQIGQQFQVVIVAEMFDESLVLMKRYLNWNLDDILYAIKNVRNKKKKPAMDAGNDPEDEILFKRHSEFDYMLYNFFKERLVRQIELEGASFPAEVTHFKEVREYVENFCHYVPPQIKSIQINKSKWNDFFSITREDCAILHKGEIKFVQEIRKRQYGVEPKWGKERP